MGSGHGLHPGFGVAPGDTLTVDTSQGATIAPPNNGTGTVSGGGIAQINFTNFEFVTSPPPLFFFPDAFEPNDSIPDATILGSETEVTLLIGVERFVGSRHRDGNASDRHAQICER